MFACFVAVVFVLPAEQRCLPVDLSLQDLQLTRYAAHISACHIQVFEDAFQRSAIDNLLTLAYSMVDLSRSSKPDLIVVLKTRRQIVCKGGRSCSVEELFKEDVLDKNDMVSKAFRFITVVQMPEVRCVRDVALHTLA